MAEDPQPLTLQQRIASLNAAHVGRLSTNPPSISLRPKPQVPNRRPIVKQKSFNIPSESNITTNTQSTVGNTPSGPPPLPTRKLPPPLPTRKPTHTSGGEGGERSDLTPSPSTNGHNAPRLSTSRTKSDENRIKAPDWGHADLPPLPTKPDPKSRTESVTEQPQQLYRTSSASDSAAALTNGASTTGKATWARLPARKPSNGNLQPTGARRLPPMPSNDALEKARKASFASSSDHVERVISHPPLPKRTPSAVADPNNVTQPGDLGVLNHGPPPIPRASKPDLSSIQASKPRLNGHSNGMTSQPSTCMICRDFSGPDNHAALFPRQHVASLQQLAQQLTSPFPSHTDKARAIFTWLHLNVDYNVKDFFSGNVRGSTPQSTLQTGLAVCEGYAALFTNIATYAGLESIVIGGHGKGFGHEPLSPNSPLPPYEAGHAWNAVRIDNGEWKLIDTCWGAGHVQGHGLPYVRKFAPERFTQSNEEFSVDHFPENKNHFFLPGGQTLTWQNYISINPANYPYPFERPTFFDNAKTDYSIGKRTVTPPNRHISLSQSDTVHFQFALFCPHWSLEHHTRKGPPPVFILSIPGPTSRNKQNQFIPLEHVPGPSGSALGGDIWFVDVPSSQLGAPGETLTMFAVGTFGDRRDARGLSVGEFREGVGRVGMSFVGVSSWEVVG